MLIYERDDDGKIVQTLYLSDNGREYSVLDMLDFHHNTTSGMVSIVDNNLDGKLKDVGMGMPTWFAYIDEADIETVCNVDIPSYESKIGIVSLPKEKFYDPLDKPYFTDKYNNRCYVGDQVRIGNCSNELIIKDINGNVIKADVEKPGFVIDQKDALFTREQMAASHLTIRNI